MAGKHGSKQKRNKKYVPRVVSPTAHHAAIRRNWNATYQAAQQQVETAALLAKFAEPMSESYQDEQSRAQKIAFSALLAGNGDLTDWESLTEVMNITLVLCERGIGSEYVQTLIDALDHLFVAKLHYECYGAWSWGDEARAAINDAIDVRDAQLPHLLQADILSAYAEVSQRIEQQHVYKEAA